jgi:hypothetical protein
MNRRIPVLSLGLVAVGLAALRAEPAAAQNSSGSQDVQIYVGEMFGDRLTDTPLSGVGYAWAHLNHELFGFAGTRPALLTDSNGYTANAGLGAKYYLFDNFFLDFDARYRYLSRLTSDYGKGLNTAQTTLSLGYRF